MIIPGLTAQDQFDVIDKVVKNHRNKLFGIYSAEDIEQEAWLIALQKIPDFKEVRGTQKDIKKSLEHWLNTVISNRLKNLYRDKYLVPQRLIKGKKEKTPNNLMSPLDIANNSEDCSIEFFSNLDNELWIYVIDRLDFVMSDLLDSLMSGEKLNAYYKGKLHKKINQIMEEYNNGPTSE